MMDPTITPFPAVTLAVALLGAALGIISTLHTLDKSRVKLRIIPAHAIPVGAMNPNLCFCIEVTNLSAFAVTLCEASLFHRGTRQRSILPNPVILDGGSWPRRLESRSSVALYGALPESPPGGRIRCAYARASASIGALALCTPSAARALADHRRRPARASRTRSRARPVIAHARRHGARTTQRRRCARRSSGR
jgi:hypothetical protein